MKIIVIFKFSFISSFNFLNFNFTDIII